MANELSRVWFFNDEPKYDSNVKQRKRKQAAPQFSKCLEDFAAMVRRTQSDYAWNAEEVNRLDKETQDYLHKLELEDLDYSERAKVATALRNCRRYRRMSKDTVEVLEPFINFLNTDRGRNLINLTNEVLGQTRKIEERMKTRTYRYKVLEEEKDE